MWRRPPLSVALLTYNRSRYLRAALEGLLAQTWGDFELLVLDNASTDDTPETVLACKDPRLVYIRQPPGKLSGYNWASALWMARGEYLLITHDDDVPETTLLARQMEAFAKRPALAAVATNVSIVDASGAPLQPRLYPWTQDRQFECGEYLEAFLKEKLWVPMQTCLFRRELMARLVGLGRTWSPAPRLATLATGDILNAIQLNSAGELRILQEPLLRYRQHGKQEGRGVDQNWHMIELFKRLRKAARRDATLEGCRPLIEARLARYQAQDLLLRTREPEELPRLKRQAERLLRGLEKGLAAQERSELLLPLLVLAQLLGLRTELQAPPARLPEDRTTRAFAAWRDRLAEQGGLLSPGGPRRIAILGSLLTAGLLALEARRSGVELVCFLESSPARQGERLLGRDIHPVAWLDQHSGSLDAILISSEGEGEEGIRAMLRGHLGSASLPILSWKDCAEPGGTR